LNCTPKSVLERANEGQLFAHRLQNFPVECEAIKVRANACAGSVSLQAGDGADDVWLVT
jgi:hypothetical protein